MFMIVHKITVMFVDVIKPKFNLNLEILSQDFAIFQTFIHF